MKFVSKSSNLLIVLSAGLSAQPITGTPAKPTVSVRFKDGFAEVPDGELSEKMLAHPGFSQDFVVAPEFDPYQGIRQSMEPAHVVSNIVHGSVEGKKIIESQKTSIPQEMRNVIEEMAEKRAREMLRQMMEEQAMSSAKNVVTEPEKKEDPISAPVVALAKNKGGRPPVAKKEENPRSVTDAS